jgi:hypothetical protein
MLVAAAASILIIFDDVPSASEAHAAKRHKHELTPYKKIFQWNMVEGLEDELQWPDAEKRQELGAVFPGMFNGCIGVSDVKEYQVVKYLDTVKEKRSWSGKKDDQ